MSTLTMSVKPIPSTPTKDAVDKIATGTMTVPATSAIKVTVKAMYSFGHMSQVLLHHRQDIAALTASIATTNVWGCPARVDSNVNQYFAIFSQGSV